MWLIHALLFTVTLISLNPETTFCTFYFSAYYSPAAILCHPSLSTALVNKLYDLNDLEFDLPCGGHELDISWPAFSRYGYSYSIQLVSTLHALLAYDPRRLDLIGKLVNCVGCF